MIYFHDENGNIVNTYSSLSGIEYILEYDCRGKYSNMELDMSKSKLIHVACPDEVYMKYWIERHEVILRTLHSIGDIQYTTPCLCVGIGDGDFSVFMRSPVKIDWNKDYHFYPNKGYSFEPRPCF